MLAVALTDITSAEVLRAIEECDHLGRDAFLHHYGFGAARRYVLLHEGRQYDSKAIVGVAHAFLPGRQPLTSTELSGGQHQGSAAWLLRQLGFHIVEQVG